MKERRRYKANLDIFCRKLLQWHECENRMRELLEDAGIRPYGHYNSNFSIDFKSTAFITLTDLPEELRRQWLNFCWRAGIKFKEVEDFF